MMMKRFLFYILMMCVAVFSCKEPFPTGTQVDAIPSIDPDYQGLIIPANIAPLNFRILEPGEAYAVRLSGDAGEPIEIITSENLIQFPLDHWHALLRQNERHAIRMKLLVRNKEGIWKEFRTLENTVSPDAIDPVLVYRFLKPAHNFWGTMGLYQRDITSFESTPILENESINKACINCHAFNQNQPLPMMFHARGKVGSSLILVRSDSIQKINTKTAFNPSPAAYRSWHPNGKLLAFSNNKLVQIFHAAGETREVSDLASNLMLYHIEDNRISTFPAIASPERMETFPRWSPDGRYLYFCSAPRVESYITKDKKDIGRIYDEIQYDLMRIAYDAETEAWGQVESVLESSVVGKSLIMSCVSPDGRFMVFTGAHHGSFPIFVKDSDLYLMDMESGAYRELEINSEETESYHSWSGNSRWLVFSSKRRDGLCARPYFTHIDSSGQVSKAFILPQEDPACYDLMEETFNLPELVGGMVQVNGDALSTAVLGEAVPAVLDSNVRVDAQTGASENAMWQQVPQ